MTIEIMSGIMLLFSSWNAAAIADKPVEPVMPVADHPITLEVFVRDYFADNPVLAEIAKCESHFRHFDAYGILRGDKDQNDVGVMQINERYHAERAKKNGFDIKTLEGNLGYARWLYEKEGLKPWKSSGACWKQAETLALNAAPVKNESKKN